MPELVPPTSAVHASFLSAMAEFAREGRGGPDDHTMIGEEIRHNRATWHNPGAFTDYTARLRADALEETPRRPGWVPCTTLWYIEGSAYLGRLAIRHRLTPWLLEYGGHIGYDVRPSARNNGYATTMLHDALPIAKALGIADVLVTCDVDNTASRRVIEKNAGRLEDERCGKLRFWIRT
jgi:predicted acetyltransferase